MKKIFILEKSLRFQDNLFLQALLQSDGDVFFCCSLNNEPFFLSDTRASFSKDYISFQENSAFELKKKKIKTHWDYDLPILRSDIYKIVKNLASEDESIELYLEYPLTNKNHLLLRKLKSQFAMLKVVSIWSDTLFKPEDLNFILNKFPNGFSKFRTLTFKKSSWPKIKRHGLELTYKEKKIFFS